MNADSFEQNDLPDGDKKDDAIVRMGYPFDICP